MEKLSKALRRIVILEGWVNRFGRQALREIGDAYKEMLKEIILREVQEETYLTTHEDVQRCL